MRQQICSRRPIQAPTGVFPPNESAGLSAHSGVTSQVHEAFLRAIFCPRASSQSFSQAPGASRSQHRLSSFLLTKFGSHGCNAVGCANTNGHRPTNTWSSFFAPEAVLNEVEQRFDCVQAQTHMYPSLVGGFHPHPEPNSALVSSTFEITHSLIFESRCLLSVWPCGELRIFLLHAYFLLQLRMILFTRYTSLKRPKKVTLEEYSFIN